MSDVRQQTRPEWFRLPRRTWKGAGPLLVAVVLAGSGIAQLGAQVEKLETKAGAGWQADPKLLEELAARKVAWIFRENEVPPYTVPDPLVRAGGARVRTAAEWEETGRPETLELFRKWVYGRSPGRPEKVEFQVLATDPQALEGKATRKQVKITSRSGERFFSFEASLLTPNGVSGKAPAFLLINNRPVGSADPTRMQKDGFWPAEEIISRGYATAVFRTQDVDPDQKDEAARARGVRGVWPAGGGKPGEDAWATIAAWAWGASRVLDYLATEPAIDAARVAVVGHSRGGKTALWAAAEDPRFAVAVSNDSGCGGAALSRRIFGETVEIINRGFPYWFCENFKQFNNREAALPVEQNQLLALIAPRGLYVASADADFWADQRGEFLSLAHASPVYSLYGHPALRPEEMPALEVPLVRGPRGYHIRRGIHNLTPYDWGRYMDFTDRLWSRRASR